MEMLEYSTVRGVRLNFFSHTSAVVCFSQTTFDIFLAIISIANNEVKNHLKKCFSHEILLKYFSCENIFVFLLSVQWTINMSTILMFVCGGKDEKIMFPSIFISLFARPLL